MGWSYDLIAEIYVTDMGRSMPFDDVGWYRNECAARGGRVLELGCGTGRILLPLLAAGLDVVGADRSAPMLLQLRRDAAAQSLPAPRLLQMDLRAPALRGSFDTILLPYSLITYVVDRDAAAGVLAALRALLASAGCIVLDAFIPQPVQGFADYRRDYDRPHADGRLVRDKRIATLGDGCNRIERRYRRYAADGALLEEIHTDETIRPYAPADLHALADAAGCRVVASAWDYGEKPAADGARFATLTLAAT